MVPLYSYRHDVIYKAARYNVNVCCCRSVVAYVIKCGEILGRIFKCTTNQQTANSVNMCAKQEVEELLLKENVKT